MKRLLLNSILVFIASIATAQDTLFVEHGWGYNCYVIDGKKEMILTYPSADTDSGYDYSHPKDTTYSEEVSQEHLAQYNYQLSLKTLRNRPISTIYADEVMDYFRECNETEFKKKLGKKKYTFVEVGNYRVTFLDKSTKKNVVFEFEFGEDGKLHKMSRPHLSKSYGTTDIKTAFEIEGLRQDANNLDKEIKRNQALRKRLKQIQSLKAARAKQNSSKKK